MIVYGYTVLDTLGFGDGTDTRTSAFATAEEMENDAYEYYRNECKLADEEEELDEDYEILDKQDFIAELRDCYVNVWRNDSHFQIVAWHAEI